MISKEKRFQMSEEELVVLNAFFLSLPLPPMMDNDADTANLDLEGTIQKATQSLQEKGWVTADHSDIQNGFVQPELAGMLRDIAYGNQMVHLYYQHRGENACQVAYYRNGDRFVYQELSSEGEHIIHSAEDKMGRALVEKCLSDALDGERGKKAQITLDVWHSLLSSRVAGIDEEVLAALNEIAGQTVDEDTIIRQAFAKDVLAASIVLEVTCVYDRLENEQDKASFVLTDKTNWLVFPTTLVAGQDRLLVMKATRTNLLHTVAGLFAPLNSDNDMGGK